MFPCKRSLHVLDCNKPLSPCKICGKTPYVVQRTEYYNIGRRALKMPCEYFALCGTKGCPENLMNFRFACSTKEGAVKHWNKRMEVAE